MAMSWWYPDYIYRRKLLLTAPNEPVRVGHPAEINLGSVLIDYGKVRSDFEDIEVVYVDEDGEHQLLYRETELEETEFGEGNLWVRFLLYDEIGSGESVSDSYFIYYGNPSLDGRPERPGFDFIDGGFPDLTGELGTLDGGAPGTQFEEGDEVDGGDPWVSTELKDVWPVTLAYFDEPIAYTRPGEHWVDGVSSRPFSRATVQISCTRFRIISTVGPDKGIMEVQTNNETRWKQVDLYSALEFPAAVFEMSLDPSNMNEIRIRVAESTNPNSYGNEVNIVNVQYTKSIILKDLGEQVKDIAWSSSTGGAA